MPVLFSLLVSLLVVSVQGFTFGVSANFGSGTNYTTTVASVGGSNPDFMLALGDFSDQVGTESAWCQAWKDSTVNNLFLLAGTRETGENVGGTFSQYSAACPLAINTTGTYGHQYYFDYPVVSPYARFVFIDPLIALSSNNYTLGGAGYAWLANVLADARASGIIWIVVNMHKIFITAFPKTEQVGADVMALLFDNHVDLIIHGHEQGYLRSKQLQCAVPASYSSSCVVGNGNTLNGGNSTVLLAIGTGGQSPLGDFNSTGPEAGYFESIQNTSFGFGRFSVNRSSISFDFVVSGGAAFSDSFVISKSTSAPTRAPTSSPTRAPTSSPTSAPTSFPTFTPTLSPTLVPTATPSVAPTVAPTLMPTAAPTGAPTSAAPSFAPTTEAPTHSNETLKEGMHTLTASDYKSVAIVTFVMVLLLVMFLLVLLAQYLKRLPVRPRTVTRTIEREKSAGDKDGTNSHSRKDRV